MTLLEPCQDRQPLLLSEQGQSSSPRLHKSKCKEGEIIFDKSSTFQLWTEEVCKEAPFARLITVLQLVQSVLSKCVRGSWIDF